MQIDTILYQLLLQHECIIVPNFGGFIVRESPCNFNANKDIIKPYSKSVFYNPHLNENDGLLINAIMNVGHISYNEANALLEKWVESQNNSMAENGRSVISRIGSFFKGNDNGKWFTADPQLNLALTTYGLKPVKAGIANSNTIKAEPHKIEYKPLADNKPIEAIELPKTSWRAWAAAAAIALVAHIGYLSFEPANKPVNEASVVSAIVPENKQAAETVITETPQTDTSVIETPPVETPVETIAPVEEPIQEIKADEPVVVKVKEPEVIIAEPAAVETPVIETSKVVGKYRLEQNAIFHQRDLAKTGIIATVQLDAKGLYEVIIPLN